MKYAIIGLGFIYPRHKQAIEKVGGEIILTCDIDPEKNADFTDWKEMMNSEKFKEVDWVIVCTPNYLHLPIADAALMRGKKVLSEKPLAIDRGLLEHFTEFEDLFTVLQLRHHPHLESLKKLEEEGKIQEAELFVKVKREQKYWDGWKGDEKQSGGILYNIGVHYFDALIQIFGADYRIVESYYTPALATGLIEFNGQLVKYHVEICPTDEGQDRYISVNGEKFRFSNQDNLSYEDLHEKVYREMLEDRGVRPNDIMPVTKLIERLKEYART